MTNIEALRAMITGYEMAHQRSPLFILLSGDMAYTLRQDTAGTNAWSVREDGRITLLGIEVGRVNGEKRVEVAA